MDFNTISWRDAVDRVLMLNSAGEARTLYEQATANNDAILARAIEAEAARKGWNIHTNSTPDLAAAAEARAIAADLIGEIIDAPNVLAKISLDNDPRLTFEAQQAARTQHTRTWNADLEKKAQDAVARLDKLRTSVEARANALRPTLDRENPLQVTRTGQAWQFTIQPQLANGSRWETIIPNLDEDGLLALAKFGPGHIAATTEPFGVDAETVRLKLAIDEAMASAAGNPDARSALRAEQTVTTVWNEVRSLASGIINLNPDRAASLAVDAITAAGRVGVLDATHQNG